MIPRWLTDNLLQVARQLRPLEIDFAFLGGCIVPFLLDDPDLMPMRPTNDVDVVLYLIRQSRMAEVEDRLRRQGFVHADEPGAPMCRWRLGEITVDIMPDREAGFMGLNTQWFPEALRSAQLHPVPGGEVPIISAPLFVATKLSAFADRGRHDYYHHDLEDVVTVFDGRASMPKEWVACDRPVREYMSGEIRRYLTDGRFMDSLPGHLSSDMASQARLAALIETLRVLAALS